ncbi:MAG: DUF1549 and DUF1553 domain-containing protein [Planctomycetes bacterium]|nr:DUF1549 and DUF1553 domain-containing protein [Planctomycetota bacterium]
MRTTIRLAMLLSVLFLGDAEVRAAGRSPQAVAADIDAAIEKLLTENKIPFSARTDDAEFLRRVSLDVTGRIPTLERTNAFLSETAPDKRSRLIDELLSDHEYGEHFAVIWYHRIVKPDDDNRFTIRGNTFQDWLEASFNKNNGWNKIASDILLATGPRDKHPETSFFLAHVDGAKGGYEPAPNKITSAASKLFLGVKLECCECHNHPFNAMKQTDYWGVAAFFSDVHSNNARKKDLKDGAVPGITDGIVAKKKDPSPHPFGSIEIPDSKGKTVKAKYLGGAEASLANRPLLRKLFVTWLTSPQNKYFASAAVNKMWANFFGRGIVNPVDDMIDTDRATHPEVLKLLAKEFSESNYDLKYLIRCICNSQTYQRTSSVLPANKDDDKLYSHMPVKVMSADMLYDSLQIVLGHGVSSVVKGEGKKKGGNGGPRDEFRKFFHAEADDDVGVVDDYTHGVPQVLRLMNSQQISNTTATVAKLMKAGEPAKIIESMYLTALSRNPTPEEVKKMTDYAAADKFSAKAYGDLLWVLLNTGEFLFNH